jgi:predicted phage-related endonuclease
MNTAILNPSIQQPSTPFIAPKLFTAKRLVNTKNMTQAEWLEVDAKVLAVVIVPQLWTQSLYVDAELWMIKTGRVKQSIEDESAGHAPLYWGKQLEPLVAEYYSMHTNNKSVVSMPCYNILMRISILCCQLGLLRGGQ